MIDAEFTVIVAEAFGGIGFCVTTNKPPDPLKVTGALLTTRNAMLNGSFPTFFTPKLRVVSFTKDELRNSTLAVPFVKTRGSTVLLLPNEVTVAVFVTVVVIVDVEIDFVVPHCSYPAMAPKTTVRTMNVAKGTLLFKDLTNGLLHYKS